MKIPSIFSLRKSGARRILMAVIFVAACASGARAEEAYFYVAGTEGIYRDSVEVETGRLGSMTPVAQVKDVNFMALAPGGKFLYATLDAKVAAFAVGAEGRLTKINEVKSGGAGPCHVAVDATGREVFVANYGGGNIAGFRVGADGALGAETAFEQFSGSGPDRSRQAKSYAHSVWLGPEGRTLYACDLGSDHVWIFKLDAATGGVVASEPPSASVPPGSGPRHLAFDPTGRFVYVANEMGASVTAFERDAATGALKALETVSTLAAGTSAKGVTTAEIVCHPSGKWLYVSNRGSETISVFALGADGKPELIESVPSVAQFPRSFALDPGGRWLVVAGQKGNEIAVLKIDAVTGKLAATGGTAAVKGAVCVVFE